MSDIQQRYGGSRVRNTRRFPGAHHRSARVHRGQPRHPGAAGGMDCANVHDRRHHVDALDGPEVARQGSAQDAPCRHAPMGLDPSTTRTDELRSNSAPDGAIPASTSTRPTRLVTGYKESDRDQVPATPKMPETRAFPQRGNNCTGGQEKHVSDGLGSKLPKNPAHCVRYSLRGFTGRSRN